MTTMERLKKRNKIIHPHIGAVVQQWLPDGRGRIELHPRGIDWGNPVASVEFPDLGFFMINEKRMVREQIKQSWKGLKM
jgi:hypothetical protein